MDKHILYGLAIVGAITCLIGIFIALLIGGRFVFDFLNSVIAQLRRPHISLVCGILGVVFGIPILLVLTSGLTSRQEVNWNLRQPDTAFPVEVDDGQFHLRVAALIKKQTGYEVVPAGDLLRVYKGKQQIGLVRCVRFGRMATPDMVRELVAIAQQERVKTMYFASGGHVGNHVERAAGLHKVKLLAL